MKPIALPPKPRFMTPCNRCGICCQMSLCPIAEIVYSGAEAPCPALRIEPDGKATFCGLMRAEEMAGLPRTIAGLLGAGKGCTMADELPGGEPIR